MLVVKKGFDPKKDLKSFMVMNRFSSAKTLKESHTQDGVLIYAINELDAVRVAQRTRGEAYCGSVFKLND